MSHITGCNNFGVNMKAWQIEQGSLVAVDADQPVPQTGELLIKVAAVGVNRADLYQLDGLYPAKGLSSVPGLEVAGEVVGAAGKFKKGQRVMALTNGGAYAEYVATPASQCFAMPDNMSFEDAAATPEALFTCWMTLVEIAAMKKDDKVLIYGGSSGVGTMAIQLVRESGAAAYATASSEQKITLCQELGAIVYDYKNPDWTEKLKKDSGGVDIILDMLGGRYTDISLSLLRHNGRMVTIALQDGRKAEIDLAPLLARQIKWQGATLRPRSTQEKADYASGIAQKWLPLLEKKRIFPQVNSQMAFADAPEALKLMRGRTHCGKIILSMQV